MERRAYLKRARRVFFAPGSLETDANFKSTLAKLGRTGLQWGGMLGLTGILVLVLVHWGALDRPTSVWYPTTFSPDAFVLWDKAVVGLACISAVVIGRRADRLSVVRWSSVGLAIAVAAVSLIHDAYRGILSVEYLILVYLLAVAVVPYRPWHTALLGIGLTALFYVLGHYGLPGTAAAAPDLVRPGHLVRMGFATVVLTGVSALLYSTRYEHNVARQEAEELHDQVAMLERAKSRFFADVSHELRTPLTIILGSVDEALEGRLEEVPEALQTRLDNVRDQARRMKRLVNQLFDLSSVDEGRLTLTARKEDLVSLTQQIVPPFREWARDEGLSFHLEVDVDRLDVWIDRSRFEHVLSNLLSNAIESSPRDGTVRVRIEKVDDHAEIAVRDTGPGLPSELQARVFERPESTLPVRETETSDADTVEEWIGLGIGLAHARALVRRHGGTLEAESEPGFGTEITARVPLGRDHLAEEDVADGPPASTDATDFDADIDHLCRPAVDTGNRPSPPDDAAEILVVDDQAEMRSYLQDLLGHTYRVTTAPNGQAALETLQERAVDLVISDVVMPEMDGIALCRAIREDDRLRSLPVLLLTGRQETDDRLSGLEAGADAYVSKPFDLTQLEARIENLIEIRRIVQDQVRVPEWMEPKDAAVSTEEADFLETLNETVDAHIDNSNFGVDWLADEMDLSARHLRRRLKEVTRLSPAGFIRTRRLQHAAALLRDGADTVSDVADAVGYRDASYFSRLFRETFGCSPSEYAEKTHESPDDPDTTP